MPNIQKGQFAPLNVTQKSRRRVFVGLGWDPKDDVTIIDKAVELVGGRKAHHDLDLSCFLYNENRSFIQSVAANGKNIDESGQIYHSGDNVEGLGDGDDEQISAELKDLNAEIHHIVFAATIKSGHMFGDITAPEIRLADGYSDHDFLRASLNHAEGKHKTGFVFVHIYRLNGGDEDMWMMHNVSEFIDADDLEEWPALITAYIKTQDVSVK